MSHNFHERIQEIAPPPTSPSHVPSEEVWTSVESKLGASLPAELKWFSQTYGLGTFRGSQTTAISIYSVGPDSFVNDINLELARFREIRGEQSDEAYPFNVFPEGDGLFPLGIDESDIWICWKCAGDPEQWPITVRWSWGEQGMREFDLPLTQFLTELFERSIELPCWPHPTFLDDMKFVPYSGP